MTVWGKLRQAASALRARDMAIQDLRPAAIGWFHQDPVHSHVSIAVVKAR